jgi:hypothetical protein
MKLHDLPSDPDYADSKRGWQGGTGETFRRHIPSVLAKCNSLNLYHKGSKSFRPGKILINREWTRIILPFASIRVHSRLILLVRGCGFAALCNLRNLWIISSSGYGLNQRLPSLWRGNLPFRVGVSTAVEDFVAPADSRFESAFSTISAIRSLAPMAARAFALLRARPLSVMVR